MSTWRPAASADQTDNEAVEAWAEPVPAPAHPLWVHILLFCLTLFTMTATGAMQQGVDPLSSKAGLVHLIEGIPFAATLLAILTVHEFGHYFAARYWGVKATLPYFLPFLPHLSLFGTLGAVIRIRSSIPNKRALLDIGAAGPLAGLVVAIGACIIGLYQSEVVTSAYFYPEGYHLALPLGSPLLFSGIAALVRPEALGADTVLLSPVAFAGWVGLFITAFNLFPIGQLDGGHIVYALFGRKHRLISQITYITLIAMGGYGILSQIWDLPPGFYGWLVLAFIMTVFGKGHPTPYDPVMPLDRRRRWVGYTCLLAFAVCLTPVPF